MISTGRFARLAAIVFVASGLSREQFADLPREARPASRKTADHYRARAQRNRYSGQMLREIRAHGQARECARRRRHPLLLLPIGA